ncbi:hypothetical protein LCGC14_3106550, partial [marine sediment metagenome]
HARTRLPAMNALVWEMYEVLCVVAKRSCLDPKKDTEPIHGGFYVDCFECYTCEARIIIERLEA